MQKLLFLSLLVLANSMSFAYSVIITNNSAAAISIKDNRAVKCNVAAKSSGNCSLDAHTTYHATYLVGHSSYTLFILHKNIYQTLQVTPITPTTSAPEFLIDFKADHEYAGSLGTMKTDGKFHYNGNCQKGSHNYKL